MSFGSVLIMIAAGLWAVDALIRTPLTQTLTPISIVFWEHVVGLFVLSPFVWHAVKTFRTLRSKDWLWFAVLALVSSVGGTVLFTQALSSSFSTGDFITPLLLQKLQPLLVIGLSFVFLKEQLTKRFLLYAALAIAGGYMMSFGFTLPVFSLAGKELVVLLSLGAAACWASGTIISKTVLKTVTPRDSLILRFLLAIPIAFVTAQLLQTPIQTAIQPGDWLRFFLIALTTGTAALFIYYVGLKKTPAHVATIAELIFPFISVLIGITSLNPYGQAQILTLPQVIGIALLVFGVFKSTSKL